LKVRIGGDDAQITDHRQDDTGPDRGSVDRAYDRDRRLVDGQVQRLGLVGQVLGHPRGISQVGARAEHPALAGQDDRADVFGGGLLDRLTQGVHKLTVQRVAAFFALHLQGHYVAVAGRTNHGDHTIRVFL
jgi:hypothetical protein